VFKTDTCVLSTNGQFRHPDVTTPLIHARKSLARGQSDFPAAAGMLLYCARFARFWNWPGKVGRRRIPFASGGVSAHDHGMENFGGTDVPREGGSESVQQPEGDGHAVLLPPQEEPGELPHRPEADSGEPPPGGDGEAGGAGTETGDRIAESDGEPGGEGYDRMAAATAAYEKLAVMAGEFNGVIMRIVVQQMNTKLALEAADGRDAFEHQVEVAEQVQSAVQQMQQALAEMLRTGAGQDPGLAFTAAAQAESARSGTKYARKHWPGRLWDAAWGWLKGMFPLLWSIIGHLVTVKEWTVTGQAGGSILGFPQASVSVTFGKP